MRKNVLLGSLAARHRAACSANGWLAECTPRVQGLGGDIGFRVSQSNKKFCASVH